ncbi:MAG: hypothetical protein Q6K99_04730 [Thermostichales cyanobacterium BF4_bins_65]
MKTKEPYGKLMKSLLVDSSGCRPFQFDAGAAPVVAVELGGWVEIDPNWAVQITKVETATCIDSGNAFAGSVSAENGKLMVVYMTVRNQGQEAGSLVWSRWQLLDAQAQAEVTDLNQLLAVSLWREAQGLRDPGERLLPGAMACTALVFRVSREAEDWLLRVRGLLGRGKTLALPKQKQKIACC